VDTLKARLQVAGSRAKFGRTAVDVLRRTLETEGVRGLYRGFGAVAVVGTPAGCLYLTTYDVLAEHAAPLARDGLVVPEPVVHFACGVVAEAVACLLYVPVDVVKERAQVVSARPSWSSYSLGTLYRGYGATLVSFGAYSGCYFALYDGAKRRLLELIDTSSETTSGSTTMTPQTPFSVALLASLAAGAAASWLTAPLDLAKLRLQVEDLPQSSSSGGGAAQTTSPGIVGLLGAVYRRDGLAGLFRGAGARVAFFAPSTAIAMACFEAFKSLRSRGRAA